MPRMSHPDMFIVVVHLGMLTFTLGYTTPKHNLYFLCMYSWLVTSEVKH